MILDKSIWRNSGQLEMLSNYSVQVFTDKMSPHHICTLSPNISRETLPNAPPSVCYIMATSMPQSTLNIWQYIQQNIARVSCKKGPICHAEAWRVGPFLQDTLDCRRHLNDERRMLVRKLTSHREWTVGYRTCSLTYWGRNKMAAISQMTF